MEVQVRNVPRQATRNVLNNFLKPYLEKLSIMGVQATKHNDKTWASLTFLHVEDAERFLFNHGQVRVQGKPTSRTRDLLKMSGQPVYFEKSHNQPDPITLRGLGKEVKDRLARHHPSQPTTSKPVNFDITSVSCGNWSYVNNELVYVPQQNWDVRGTAAFGQRSMILRLKSGKRIDFRYPAILELIGQESPGALILSLKEVPRFFENISQPVDELLQQLFLKPDARPQTRMRIGPDRHRLPCLDESHQAIAANCLVYRVALPYVVGGSDYHRSFRSLKKPHLPQVINRYTRVREPLELHAVGMKSLDTALSSLSLGIPFEIAFQVQRLALNNFLPPRTVLGLLPEIRAMVQRSGPEVSANSVRKLFNQIDYPSLEEDAANFEIAALEELLKENEQFSLRGASLRTLDTAYEADEISSQLDYQNLDIGSDNVALIHRAKITPTGLILGGPDFETNNRVLRKYPNNHGYFLRVIFCDEDGNAVRTTGKVSNELVFHSRFKKVLNEGIKIAGRRYNFLGFSHSSLRMQTCWFLAPFVFDGSLMYDLVVIRELGDFATIQSPAKCAARIGQAFSDTPTTIKMDGHEIIPDVERNGRVFSDGVGTISRSIAERIRRKLKRRHLNLPMCFQIRYQGAKGMIALDSRLEGDVFRLRPSMIKFEGSNSTDLEICESAYRPLPLYLNRQLIKILEDMGVEDSFFLNLQAKEVARLRMITENPFNVTSFLRRQSIGEVIFLPWLITELASFKLDFRNDGFLRHVVEVAILFELRQLKHKTRIPVEKGWHLHGIMDETGFLQEGQIFCTVTVEGQNKIITGDQLIVSRSPALHPGDVQLADAVLPPLGSPLLSLSNCIVFSQIGERDLPSQLSGGDLDGDRFCIIFDENARPKRSFTPADYPRQEAVDIGRQVETADITEFFIQFMESDQLGRIAVSHRVLADVNSEGTYHQDCLTLAAMHSTAVDFSKTGIPVDMSQLPRTPKFRPDFEAPGPHVLIEKLGGATLAEAEYSDPQEEGGDDDIPRYRYYESMKVLGKLYRAIDERKILEDIKHRESGVGGHSSVINAVWTYVQRECRLISWEHKRNWALDIRDMYEDGLWNVMIGYSEHALHPLSELEAFVGNILGKTGAQTKVQHDKSVKMKERVDENNWFIVNCILKDGTEYSNEALERSIACLAVSLDQNTVKQKEQLLSFKYLAAAVCLKQVKRLFLRPEQS